MILLFSQLTIFFKFAKFGLYVFFVCLFFRRAKVDEDRFGIYAGIFFLCMSLGSILEVIWTLWAAFGISTFYTIGIMLPLGFINVPINGESVIYLLGFVGLGVLSVGVERHSVLKTKGIISLVPFGLAVAIFFLGTMMIQLPQYLIALTVAVVPLLYLYIGYRSEGDVRRKAYLTFGGYIFIFGGEALNIHILTRALDYYWWLVSQGGIMPVGHDAWMGLLWPFEPILPILIIFGLILCWFGYKRG